MRVWFRCGWKKQGEQAVGDGTVSCSGPTGCKAQTIFNGRTKMTAADCGKVLWQRNFETDGEAEVGTAA